MGASDGAMGATTEQGAPVSGLTEAPPDRDFGAALLDTAQTLMCVLDREGRIVRFNRACEEATGFASEEVVGRLARDFVIPREDADAFAAWLEEVWSSRAPNPQQGHWLTKSGGRRLIAWANRPLVDDDGDVRLLVTSGLDITERESAASELWSLQAELRDRLQELSRLAAEQAALRRVATLVARERAPEEVFSAVTEEAGRLLEAESSALLSYSVDGRVGTIVGRWTEADTGAFPVGTVIPVEGENSLTVTVARTGKAGRINDYTDISGEAARRIRAYGFHSVVAAPVVVGARVWGLLIVATQRPEPLVEGAEQRLENFAELVALALGSADARNELAASRARIVEAADAARRRLERDLHDGAQQRLVALSMTLRLARARVEQQDAAAAAQLLESAGHELQQGLEQLREVARGIHPALLSERGLRPALEVAGHARAVPGRARRGRRALRPSRRGRRLLPGVRGADQRGQVRRPEARDHHRLARGRPARGADRRRRRRRRRSRRRHRAARAGRPRGRPGRPPARRKPRGHRHGGARRAAPRPPPAGLRRRSLPRSAGAPSLTDAPVPTRHRRGSQPHAPRFQPLRGGERA